MPFVKSLIYVSPIRGLFGEDTFQTTQECDNLQQQCRLSPHKYSGMPSEIYAICPFLIRFQTHIRFITTDIRWNHKLFYGEAYLTKPCTFSVGNSNLEKHVVASSDAWCSLRRASKWMNSARWVDSSSTRKRSLSCSFVQSSLESK